MFRNATLFSASAVVLALCAGPSAALQDAGMPEDDAAAPTAASSEGALAVVAASDLMDQPVEGPSGEQLGTSRDLVVQPDGGVIVIVESENAQFVGIPLEALSPQPPETPTTATGPVASVSTTVDAEAIREAPRAVRLEAIDHEFVQQSLEHFSSGAARHHGRSVRPHDEGEASAADDDTRRHGLRVRRLLDIRGRLLKCNDGSFAGSIDDIAVDLGRNTAAYAIIAVSDDSAPSGSALRGLPWMELSFDLTGNVETTHDPDALASSPSLDKRKLPATLDSSPRVSLR
jgi:hypothetical protein